MTASIFNGRLHLKLSISFVQKHSDLVKIMNQDAYLFSGTSDNTLQNQLKLS